MSDPSLRVDRARLHSLTRALFAACGMDDADATLMADTLVAADLAGVHSHGMLRVPEYIRRITQGGVDPRGRPRIVREFGGCLLVDGGNSMGQVGVRFAMGQVIERARTTGVAVAAVRGSNHCGAMAYYPAMALEADQIGLATTHSLPIMPPFGGAERLIGNNPLAIALPSTAPPHLIFDGAFSVSAYGKVKLYAQRGEPLPEGWAFDAEGRPTTDPTTALNGLLAPVGGPKGAALGMIMGMLAAMLSGASYGTELGAAGSHVHAGQDSQLVAAIQVTAFEDPAVFRARVAGAIEQLRACKPAPGVDRVYAPGELEHVRRQEYRRDGIPLSQQTFSALLETAVSLGVEPPAHGLPGSNSAGN